MIDLHTHTTASDGRCSPAELVARAAAAGVTVLSVTDHDTVDSCAAVGEVCTAAGIAFVPGIEITAVRAEVDVHVLGYFLDPQSPALRLFLAEQRQRRVDRVGRMVAQLDSWVCGSTPRPSCGRRSTAPEHRRLCTGRARARAAGYVKTTNEDVCRVGCRAAVPGSSPARASPERVFEQIHNAGGIASLAHPGCSARRVDRRFAAPLDALEAYPQIHDGETIGRYRSIAERLQLGVSGGSDYHADESHGAAHPGSTSLPQEAFDQLRDRATSRATASGARTSS
jgi:predicted metal-dependent phosphoesterase TrpH